MSYLKLLSARRKTKDLPIMKALRLSEKQKALAGQGICIKCGEAEAAKSSYLCESCQADDSIEAIRDEIDALRRKLLGKPAQ
jgi:hypothetical protein